ncbi:metal-dependent transcriptional regulator [Aquimarina agarilytica]|uniref:metal-dependent transcriptional regulator n=1 Tax=Aquimarina agarilytica TaxID=1087449 RepID=UPI000287F6E2|nr:metal-dependent transcriptional regulator [Aquimarina agarilytica]
MSVAIENFVKAIYKNKSRSEFDTKPSTIAKELNISSAAATDMAKKLAIKGLLDYEKYQELKLTPSGDVMALKVIRKHRLWEALLFKLFDLSLHEIHREAELLEHETSDFLADKIHEYLGFPDYDPHGDPIPNSKGELPEVKEVIILGEAEEGTYQIARLQSDGEEFFDFCSANGLTNGAKIKVEKQFKSMGMTQVKINDTVVVLNKQFTFLIQLIHAK